MPYIPITDNQKAEMLSRIGASSIESLFSEVPEKVRYPKLDLDDGQSELETLRELSAIADKNADADSYLSFLGAGVYDHFIPSAVNSLSGRGEFLTAYTPYQSEVSQGTLQAIFEYQSMIAELTGMDTSNAGHYDGATALAEAVIMALRMDESKKVVIIPEDLHPEYREVLDTYLPAFNPVIRPYSGNPASAAFSAGTDLAALVAVYPGFSGVVSELSGAAEAAHDRGGLFIVHTDPIMLGLFKSPGEWGADIVTAEGQSLGNDLNFGGPLLGIMAVTSALTRRIPGRIVGEALDHDGKKGYVLTLAAREQHIRREKAVSNICSNQGLASLRAAMYLALMGRSGLKAAAELCWNRAHYAANQIAKIPGCKVERRTFFKEFTVALPCSAQKVAKKLYRKNIICGLPLSRYYSDRPNDLLVCVTEKNSRSDIDLLVTAIREAL
jgi:glycine dehydrogenase subunit 1